MTDAPPEEGSAPVKKPGRRKGAKDYRGEEPSVDAEIDEDHLEEISPEPMLSDTKPWWKQWPVIAGVAGLLLVGLGVSGYLVFGGRAKKPTEKKEVAKTPAKPAPAAPPATGKHPSTEPAAKPAPPRDPIKLAAARLAAELAADTEGTNFKYDGAFLEVTGLFGRMNIQEKPPRTHAVFDTEERPVSCDLQGVSPADLRRWTALSPGQPFAARGVYGKDGILHNCELVPPAPLADMRYKGKEIEVVGTIDAVLPSGPERAFPGVSLERDTNGIAGLDCFFRKDAEEEVKKILPGTLVTIRGTCNGRVRTLEGTYSVRLDNCQLVYTTAPVPPMERLDVVQFLRAYEEDLRTRLPAAPAAEERIDSPLTITAIAKDLAADARALDKKYRNRVLTLSGKLAGRGPNVLVLESGDTDQTLKVRCLFARHHFLDLADAPHFRIRGLCTGMLDPHTIRLDNCETIDPTGTRDPHRLTVDYLPHTPGKSLIYDFAAWPANGKGVPTVARQVFFQQEGGVTKTETIYQGTLAGKSLFDPGEQARWVALKKTKSVRLAGPVYYQRLAGGFVEIGQHVTTKGGDTEEVWEPVLKVGAKTGDSWKWAYANAKHEFVVAKFEEDHGRTSVLIRETVIRDAEPEHVYEIRHVLVRGVGEVERHELLPITPRETITLGERKLVEDAPPASAKDEAADKPAKPAGEPDRPGNDKASPPASPGK
jgi:hypothetical protein